MARRINHEQVHVDAAEVVQTWTERLKQLGTAVNCDGLGDRGTDVIVPRAVAERIGTTRIQVKDSIDHAIAFIRENIRRGHCVYVVVGGPGRDINIALGQLAEYSVFVGPSYEDTGDYDLLEDLAAEQRKLPIRRDLRVQ